VTAFSASEAGLTLCADTLSVVDEERIPGRMFIGIVLHSERTQPFNPTTIIRYDIQRTAKCRSKCNDVSGRMVRRS